MQITQWCKDKGISKSQYYYWQRKICESISENLPAVNEQKFKIIANAPTFTEIKLPVSNTINNVAVTISINNTTIQIHNYANEYTIAASLKVIKEL